MSFFGLIVPGQLVGIPFLDDSIQSAAKRADGMEEERIAKEKSATEFAAQARQAAEANAGWNK